MLDATLPIVTDLVRQAANPLTRSHEDYDALLAFIGDARFVLLGEASHGTHEFYCERAQITKRLIQEKGFTAIAVEADWPDAYRVNRYVSGESADADAAEALAGFRRFPAWMWRKRRCPGLHRLAARLQLFASLRRLEGGLLWFGPLQPACLNRSRSPLSG